MITIETDLCTHTAKSAKSGKILNPHHGDNNQTRYVPVTAGNRREPDANPAGYDPVIVKIGFGMEASPEGHDPGIVKNGCGLEASPEGQDPVIAGTGLEQETDPAFLPGGNEPGRTAALCTRVRDWQLHLPGRLRKKLVTFDRRIAAFRKGGWS